MTSPAVSHVVDAFEAMGKRYRSIVEFRADRTEPSSSFLIDEFRPHVLDGLLMGDVERVVAALQTIHHKHSFIIQKCHCSSAKTRSLDVATVFLCEEALNLGKSLMYQPEEAPRCRWWGRCL